MKPIQAILVALLAALVAAYFARFRSRLLDRLGVLTIGVTGIALVAKPDWSTLIAEHLGVGRGADLITYLGLMGLAFLLLLAYVELRALNGRVTELVQFLAINQAYGPRHRAEEAKQPTPPKAP